MKWYVFEHLCLSPLSCYHPRFLCLFWLFLFWWWCFVFVDNLVRVKVIQGLTPSQSLPSHSIWRLLKQGLLPFTRLLYSHPTRLHASCCHSNTLGAHLEIDWLFWTWKVHLGKNKWTKWKNDLTSWNLPSQLETHDIFMSSLETIPL